MLVLVPFLNIKCGTTASKSLLDIMVAWVLHSHIHICSTFKYLSSMYEATSREEWFKYFNLPKIVVLRTWL